MAIKADRWIQEMALTQGMIEPFVADQVRGGAISYGLSSYGYDMRVADEWKVFTNVFNTLVDPKHFDPRSFVDIKADYIDIPPNSFALARSVEYFRIPRRVLCVVLGKCLAGDTRVVDATTGAYLPIREMTSAGSTVSLGTRGLQQAESYGVISQGVKPVYRMQLRSGRTIRATANHPFLTGSGWAQLQELQPGMRIAAARTMPVFGKTPIPDWEATLLGLMISEGQCATPGHSPTYTSADPCMIDVLRACVTSGLRGQLTYRGRYSYRLVNKIGRGGMMARNRASAWLESHGLTVGAHAKFVPQPIFMAPRSSVVLFLRALFSGDGSVYAIHNGFCIEYASSSRRLIDDVQHLLLRFGIATNIHARHRKGGRAAWVLTMHNSAQITRFAEQIGFWPGSVNHQALEQLLPQSDAREPQRLKGDFMPGEVWPFARQLLGKRSDHAIGRHGSVQPDRMTYQQAEAIVQATRDPWMSMLANQDVLWDSIISIEPDGEEEVFDICVPELHNFVANGLIVHNSTYARCFSADTRVALVDGSSASLAALAEDWERGEGHWGYSVGPHGQIGVTLLEQPRYIGRDSLIEITLDNGRSIQCTPDHEFLLRDGSLCRAGDLRPGSSLMPLYTELFRGDEGVYQPLTGHYTPTHHLADEWNLRHGIYAALPDSDHHHLDHNRRNNNPWNIKRMPRSEHIRYHNQEYYDAPDFDPATHSQAIHATLQLRAEMPVWIHQYAKAQSNRVVAFWNEPRYASVKNNLIERRKEYWSGPASRDAQPERQMHSWSDPERRLAHSQFPTEGWRGDAGQRRAAQAEIARAVDLRTEITADDLRQALSTTGSLHGAAHALNCDRSVFRRFPEIVAAFRGSPGRNHKVAAIRELPGTHDVYCLSVPEAGNFALDAGVFVRNCGLIVNVTPLEPAWQGYVTIEISNTTPLPARVYANEGVAQVLFFESDEDCLTSYADKAGKYQNQVGVVPPRM